MAVGRSRFAMLAFALAGLAAAIAPATGTAATGGVSTTAGARAQAQSIASYAFSPMRSAAATWYGPGLYGNRTACGQTLRPRTLGVAHRSLPCGTAVRFVYRGRSVITRVIDRGPFSAGHDWDLTNGTRLALRFDGSNVVRYSIARRYARR